MTRPLQGCRVLDLGIITAGAATGALLADLGAEVIKVESPAYRDPFREWIPGDDAAPDELSPFFRYTNRGKRGISLDMKGEAGRAAFLRLAAESHVVLENFRRGVMGRLGIDYPALRRVRGDIILASISSQGETGPDAAYVSYGTTLEAMAGLAATTGYAGGPPVASGKDLNYPDQVVAIFAAGMIATAWMHRQRTGEGAHLDISQRELTGFMSGEAFLHPDLQGRRGNAEHGCAFQDCFRAADGWLAVTVREGQLAALDGVLPPGPGGHEHRIAAWVAELPRAEAVRALGDAGLAAAPVLGGAEVLADRGGAWHHAIAADPEGRLFKGFPFQLDGEPMTVVRDAPQIGAHTEEVLRDIGGYSDQEIADLLGSGAIECAAIL